MAARLPTDSPDRAAWTFGAVPLRDAVLGSKQRDAALVLLAASGLVLVVACANLGGLLLAYMSGRRHELAVRAAIGATRGRLIRQLMTESLVLALVGGLLGVIIAQWGVDLFIGTLGKPGGASWMSFSVDGRVLLFALGTSVATALLFGMAPAIGGSRVDIRGILQEDRPVSGSARRRRIRGGLVAAQVALSLGLVTGAASVVMSAVSMGDAHPGFDRGGLMVLHAPLPGARYDAAPQRMAFVAAARDRLRAVPGISGVSAVSDPPLVDRNVPATSFVAEGWTSADSLPFVSFRFVDSDYLDVMRIPLRSGRAFTSAEARDAGGLLVLINETMARRHWPGRDAVGRRLRLPGSAHPDAWFTVIGVVGDVAQRMLPSQPENQMYFPLAIGRDVSLVVRTSDAVAAGAAARDAMRAVDSSVAIALHSMDGTYRAYMRDRRLQGFVLGALGLVAVLVAALGVYGVMSLTVAERRREIAIRAALGGTRGAIVRLILRNAMRVVSAGIVAGFVLAFAVTSFLASIFFGLRAFDPRVFAATAALLAGVAIVSSWWPARAAGRVDPMAALKN
jgi:predicted permease